MTVHYHETMDVLDVVPPLLAAFPRRALLAARPGEYVIVPTSVMPPEVEALHRLGFGTDPEHVVARPHQDLLAANGVRLTGRTMHLMSGTSEIARKVARAQGMQVHAPEASICLHANLKSTCQYWLTALGMRPHGRVCHRDEVPEVIRHMFQDHHTVVVKGDHAASGLEQAVVERGDPIPNIEAFSPRTGEVVVQEWMPHDRTVSLHYIVRPNGSVLATSATDQLVVDGHHMGNVYPMRPLAPQTESLLHARGSSLAARAASAGYWGPLGVDFIITPEGEPWPTEVNARVVAPWYPLRAMRRRYGVAFPFHMRGVTFPVNTRFGVIEEALCPVRFDPKTATGALPFCFVPEHGFTYVVTCARTVSERDALAPRVDECLAALAPMP